MLLLIEIRKVEGMCRGGGDGIKSFDLEMFNRYLNREVDSIWNLGERFG